VRIAIAATLVASVLVSCGDAPQPPVEPPDVVKHLATRDTVRVVVQETLRTVVHDTVRTVFTDTQRTVVFDTVRTVLLEERIQQSHVPTDLDSARARYDHTAVTASEEIRAGRLSRASLAFVTRNIPELKTISAAGLDSTQRALLAALSGLAPDQIVKVRWGKSLAPSDHPLARGAFLSVWTGSGELAIAKLDSTGKVATASRH